MKPIPFYIGADMDWSLEEPLVRGVDDAGTATVTAQLYGADGVALGSPISLAWAPETADTVARYIGAFPASYFPVSAGSVAPNKPGTVATTYAGAGGGYWVTPITFVYQT